MPTNTLNYGLNKPLVNNATDQDLWGGYLNDDMDELDGLLLTAMDFTPSAKTSSFSVSAPTLGTSSTGGSNVLYLVDATSGTVTATLPSAASCSGMKVAFKKTDSSSNTVIIDANGSETIDGALTYTISARYGAVIIVSDGVNWNVISTMADATTTSKGIVQLATNAETQTGTDATKATTPAGIKYAFTASQLLAAAGYQTLPGGLIMQWGTTALILANDSTSVTFPITFPNAILAYPQCSIGGAVTGSNSGMVQFTPSAVTTSGCTITNYDVDTNAVCTWFAIGN